MTSHSENRPKESFQIVETTEYQSRRYDENSFCAKHRNTLIVAGVLIIVLFVLFLTLGLTGVFDTPILAETVPSPTDTWTDASSAVPTTVPDATTVGENYPTSSQSGYYVRKRVFNDTTGAAIVELEKDNTPQSVSSPITSLTIKILPINSNIVRIKLTDTNSERYEVPCDLAPFSCSDSFDASDSSYIFEVTGNDTELAAIKVRRKSNNRILWNTDIGALIYADQYLEISSRLPSKDIYGIGEHSRDEFRHDLNNKTWGMFSRDQPPGGSENLYGVHPYLLVVEDEEGHAFGSLLLNSNAMEVQFTTTDDVPAITYRTIGGILDFYLFLGDSPAEVTRHYLNTIGKPYLPPYWALGFQLSRYGYNSLENMRAAVERTITAQIPLDVFYGDIDTFQGERNFLIRTEFKDLPQYVDDKKAQNIHYVTILDPCIAADTTYAAFQRGLNSEDQHAFIRWPDGYTDSNNQSYTSHDATQPPYLLGHVWPATRAVFIDFMSEAGKAYWTTEVRLFHDIIKFDALWIDMNEPTNFGTNGDDTWYSSYSEVFDWSLNCTGNASDKLENPPFIPSSIVTGWKNALSQKTICMRAEQNGGVKAQTQYNVHSLYGHSQIDPSLRVMQNVTAKRSFVFSRSTFVGSGHRSGHWLGDNAATWVQLRQSVIGVLDFNLFGIPYVGSDICGYFINATVELCSRWMQLGAFHPFSRNHNGKDFIDQDPLALGPTVALAAREAMLLRYRLLPFLYTAFWNAHKNGETVVRSLMEVFPRDLTARSIKEQFMWSNCLLISPVLYQGASVVRAYFPPSRWFDFLSGGEMNATGVFFDLPVDRLSLPLHVRGGCIVPMQEPKATTAESLKQPFSLWIAPDETNRAKGQQAWDGGEVIYPETGNLTDHLVQNTLLVDYLYDVSSVNGISKGTLRGASPPDWPPPSFSSALPRLGTIVIAGFDEFDVSNATLQLGSGDNVASDVLSYMYQDRLTKVLHFMNLEINIARPWTLTFTNSSM